MTISTVNAAAFDNVYDLLQRLADFLEVTHNLAKVGADREETYSTSHALFAAIAERLDSEEDDLINLTMQAVGELRDATTGVAA